MITFPLFISGAEMAFTLFIALLVLGADNIPDIARGLAKTLRFVREASGNIQAGIQKTANSKEVGKNFTGQLQNEMKKIKGEFEGIPGNIKRNI